MIRLLAGVVILFGCGYMGILFSHRFKKRVKQLEELQRAMTELEYNIDFVTMTIADALNSVSKNCETEVKYVFLYVAERLKTSPGSDMSRIWRRAVDKYRQALVLSDSDISLLIEFSKNLGMGNREKEKNNIKFTAVRLKIAEDEARAEMEQNSKMCRGLGFLLGIFIVIVLA